MLSIALSFPDMTWRGWCRDERKECAGCGTLGGASFSFPPPFFLFSLLLFVLLLISLFPLFVIVLMHLFLDVSNILGNDADLLDKIYAVNLPLWLQQPDAISQLRAAVYDQDLVRLVDGSPYGVVSTPSREKLLKIAALRFSMIKRQDLVNRDTTHIVIGVPGCGRKFFVKLLIAALTIFLNPAHPTTYWASFRKQLPRIQFDPSAQDKFLIFGFEDMSSLKRMDCEHSRECWHYLMGCMKRNRTFGFIVESLQTWPEIFYRPQRNFPLLNNTVVSCVYDKPLLTAEEYADFFRVLGMERPEFASLELLHFWTGGRLSRLFDLFGHGPVPLDVLEEEALLLFPSKYPCSTPFKFEERVAWATLAVWNCASGKFPPGAIFDLPVFQVGEIEDVLGDDEKVGSLEHVLVEQLASYYCNVRLVSLHILTQLPFSSTPTSSSSARIPRIIAHNDHFRRI